MDLLTRDTEAAQAARTHLGGNEAFTVASGKRVNVRYWAPGETHVLDAEVPAGKTWRVTVGIEIVETDA